MQNKADQKMKKRKGVSSFFKPTKKKPKIQLDDKNESKKEVAKIVPPSVVVSGDVESPQAKPQIKKPIPNIIRATPAQDKQKNIILSSTRTIEEMKNDLRSISNPLLSVEVQANIKVQEQKRTQAEKQLKHLQVRSKISSKCRKKKKKVMDRASEIDKTIVIRRAGSGRPRLSETQNGLLDAIIEIATENEERVQADSRRRSEVVKCYLRLDDLVIKLRARNFKCSRSGTYLKLEPRASSSIHGRTHVETVPVRLIKPQNDGYDKHEDADFCFEVAKDLHEIGSLLGKISDHLH